MKSFGGLWGEIVSPENLERAMRVSACGKRDRPAVAAFLENADGELARLHRELVEETYCPARYTQFRIRDPKPRTISCAAFRDRVVHHALCDVCSPLIERRFIHDSYACRRGKGTHRAVLRARELCRKCAWFVQMDIRRYFDSIEHRTAEEQVHALFRERSVKNLWSTILRHPLHGQPPGRGLPIGNLTSQWIANLYLDGFDHRVMEEWRLPGYVRYMDDMLLFADGKAGLWQAVEEARSWLRSERGLTIKGDPRPVPCSEGIPFLGFRVFPGTLRIQARRLVRHRQLVRRRERQFAKGEIDEHALVRSVQSATGILSFFGFRGLATRGIEV